MGSRPGLRVTSPQPAALIASPGTATPRGQIRGSSLLLVGRLLALGINFVIQVLIVRYLSKSDYGAFAYGLSLALLLQSVLPLGLDRADTRFLALYDEHGQFRRVLGVLIFETAVILSLSIVIIATLGAFATSLLGGRVSAESARAVVLVLVCLAPITALDSMVLNAFTVFARPRAVFVRRYLLEPGLRLIAVVIVFSAHLDVRTLAVGYVAAGALGAGIYGALLMGLLRRLRAKSGHLSGRPQIAVRQLMGFGLPLLAANVVNSVAIALPPIFLGSFGTLSQVAELRAVLPAAQLTLIVSTTFAVLYAPGAARLAARDDLFGLRALHWKMSGWVTVLTFPAFALTAVFSGPVTVALFGARYEHAAPYLAVLSVGMFVQAATGFNGLTLQMAGRVRYVLGVNLAALIFAIAANIVLVPVWGGGGAVAATVGTFAFHNVLKQWGLGQIGVGAWDRATVGVYLRVLAVFATLIVIGRLVQPALLPAIVLVALASVVLLRVCSRLLDVDETFPELRRLPVLRWIIQSPSARL